jgi:hypothetical protein
MSELTYRGVGPAASPAKALSLGAAMQLGRITDLAKRQNLRKAQIQQDVAAPRLKSRVAKLRKMSQNSPPMISRQNNS